MRYSSRLWAVFPILFIALVIVPRGVGAESCRDLPHGEVEVLSPRVISGHPLLRTVVLLAPLAGAQEVTAELSLTGDAELPDSGEAVEGVEDADVEHKAGDIFRMGEQVRVEENHVISGDVVVMGSDAEILGKVNGDVVAVGGNIVLGPTASIVGDAVSIGGSISKEPGAKVYGQEVSMGGIPIPFLSQ